MTAPTDRVLSRAGRGLAELTLNRPEALNALSLDMIDGLAAALDGWRDDTDVAIVLLTGAGGRGLCAGGDVRGLSAQIRAGEADEVAAFFRREYALNAMIHEYTTPIVVFADGITMGGGIGLAGHAAVRVVTERSALAMPETRIGFTPDVGGTWLLARAPRLDSRADAKAKRESCSNGCSSATKTWWAYSAGPIARGVRPIR